MTAAFSVGLCGEKYGQSFVFRNFITSPGLKKPAIKNFVQKTGRNYYMISWAEIVLRLSLASLFGALIGLERERRHWAAGLRTHDGMRRLLPGNDCFGIWFYRCIGNK